MVIIRHSRGVARRLGDIAEAEALGESIITAQLDLLFSFLFYSTLASQSPPGRASTSHCPLIQEVHHSLISPPQLPRLKAVSQSQ